jgi:hypothetical protein
MSFDAEIANESLQADFEILDGRESQFFAPVSSDVIDGLLGKYDDARRRIVELADVMKGELGGVVHHFMDGNQTTDRFGRISDLGRLFEADGALASLNSSFWQQALNLTDVYDCMPQARRDEWNNSIREMTTPEFIEGTVRSTLGALLASRHTFFAERVDGIFRALSRSHVTNCPEGFSSRMIVEHCMDQHGYGDSRKLGYINDLRVVIAKFMGRDEPRHDATSAVFRVAKGRIGKWVTMDGGALRMRVYKVGTAHLEIHPDMAYRLNQVLAHLYPAAIPSQFRTKPKKKAKEFALLSRPLSFVVVSILSRLRVYRERVKDSFPERTTEIPNSRCFEVADRDYAACKEAASVLEAIGGTVNGFGKYNSYYQFDFDPQDVIEEIVTSGCIPETVSHQFYPTPKSIAEQCAELASIDATHTVLEPSAGQGDLAAVLPIEQTTCVEISALHCAVLKARGFHVTQADFLQWAAEAKLAGKRFDRIVMNPPFSEGRAAAHAEAAAELLAPRGRLVAVLPASLRDKSFLPDVTHDWGLPITGAFAGTGVSVALLVAEKA